MNTQQRDTLPKRRDASGDPADRRLTDQSATSTPAVELVRQFWALMATNDFGLDWPRSKERLFGAERFVCMNAQYPSHGRWRFTVNRIVGDASEAVSDVSVTDGAQRARAISFFTIVQGKIARLVEYWPEPYEAPSNRKHLTVPMK